MESEDIPNKKFIEEIRPLVKHIQELYRQAYDLYKPEVEHIIRAKTTDSPTIERLLDRILDVCGDEQMLLLFKKLCRYYWNINPHATANYIQFYREMYDSEEDEPSDL